MQDGRVEVFSRRLTHVTESLPEIVETVNLNVKAASAIIEGEVVALNSAGYPIAFQHLMRRFKRVNDISGMAKKIPLTLYLFDILYLNGDKPNHIALCRTQPNPRGNRGANPIEQTNRHGKSWGS